jgi:hypothetical protein
LITNLDLTKLKDLDIPVKPDFFPLALGWWLSIVFFIIFVLAMYFILYYYLHSLKYQTWKDFNKISKIKDHKTAFHKLNQLAKRLVIARLGREKISDLYEDKWIEFMNSLLQKPIFSKEYVDLLHKSMYAKNYEISNDMRFSIFQDYKKWFKMFLKKKI